MRNKLQGRVYRDYTSGVEITVLLAFIRHTLVVRRNRNCYCQNRIVAALKRLKDAQKNISVEISSIEGIQAQFARIQREDIT